MFNLWHLHMVSTADERCVWIHITSFIFFYFLFMYSSLCNYTVDGGLTLKRLSVSHWIIVTENINFNIKSMKRTSWKSSTLCYVMYYQQTLWASNPVRAISLKQRFSLYQTNWNGRIRPIEQFLSSQSKMSSFIIRNGPQTIGNKKKLRCCKAW